jgi:hypothetical protein
MTQDNRTVKIVSGGQTGVDRAALDFAIERGIEHGGWCPRGRLAEDGSIPTVYALIETAGAEYAERTERNVLDSDATLIIVRELPPTGGTQATLEFVRKHAKPVLLICERDGVDQTSSRLAQFLAQNRVRILNVAGPRESQAPGLGTFVRDVLAAAWIEK